MSAILLQFPDRDQRHRDRCFKYMRCSPRFNGYDDEDVRRTSDMFAGVWSEQHLDSMIRNGVRDLRKELAALEAL